MAPLKVIVFVGSVREGRMADRVLKHLLTHLKDDDHEVTVFDPKEMNIPICAQPLHFMKDQSQAPQWMRDAAEKIKTADAFIVVSAEYNCTIPPALSNMMDYFSPSLYSYRPCGIVSYSMGSLGGARAAFALRPFLAELQMVSVPSTFQIPQVMKALDEDGKPLNDHMDKNCIKLIRTLDWYAKALRQAKEAGLPELP